MAASVWIAPGIENAFWALVPLSDWIERLVAEITPTDIDPAWPNGLPSAATGAPTARDALEPRVRGRSDRPAGSILSRATSAFGSAPTILAGTSLPSENCTKTALARRSTPLAVVLMTWALVTI
ncbi:MAG: hypothetical protein M3065_13870 [Actinomycetota bacterium]|nr:hypothetical protein [Actinomycetota bacterium]